MSSKQITRTQSAGGMAASPGLRSLLAPLDYLLASGGDTRLHLEPVTLLNGYGCRPFPRPEALTFASSTATSISERGYAAAREVHEALIASAVNEPWDYRFHREVDSLRERLADLLGLARSGCEIVFSPSGTDSALHATFIGASVLGRPLASIIAAADETGSGTALAVSGRHFSSLTALGVSVVRGRPVDGMTDGPTDGPTGGPTGGIEAVPAPLRDEGGDILPMGEIDARVTQAVADAVAAGRRVLLHVMDNSKLGCLAPSPACVEAICARWPDGVQIVVDACQMRLGRQRLHAYLDRGYIVQITGSKFFTGPPFCGALIVPPALSSRMRDITTVPAGLQAYTARADWPQAWESVRAALPDTMNIGQLLRWVAAAAEMRDYFAVPERYRRLAFERFTTTVPQLVDAHPTLALLPDYGRDFRDTADNEEFRVRTIFPFLTRRDGVALSQGECTTVYRALNRDLAPLLPEVTDAAERALLGQLCHIGQPVAVHEASGRTVGALRISAGARVISETWSAAPQGGIYARLDGELDQVSTILAKIQLILRSFDRLHCKV